jgi:L-2,4-diaminobutyric acid acetyltransferase
MDMQSNQTSSGAPGVGERSGGGLEFSSPTADDGLAVHRLIAACPPLDQNSVYCNLLQCTHFADTCVAVKRGDQLVGWISAYRPPQEPDVLFVWQVAVGESARGLGLAGQMIDHLLQRPACQGVTKIKTTITPDNGASWGLFKGAARRLSGPLNDAPWFLKGDHFPPGHETEHLVVIGPFEPPSGAANPTGGQRADTPFTDPTPRKGVQHV